MTDKFSCEATFMETGNRKVNYYCR